MATNLTLLDIQEKIDKLNDELRLEINEKMEKLVSTTENGLMSLLDKQKLDNLSTEADLYILPIASDIILGCVKQGENVEISQDGTLSVNIPTSYNATNIIEDETHRFVTDVEKANWNDKYNIAQIDFKFNKIMYPIANQTTLGMVKQGNNIIIAEDGTISSIPKDNIFAYNVIQDANFNFITALERQKFNAMEQTIQDLVTQVNLLKAEVENLKNNM